MISRSSSWKTERKCREHSAADLMIQMKENGKRRMWLFALLSFVMLLCYPVIVTLTLNRYADGSALSLALRQSVGHDILGFTGGMTVLLLTAGGILCAAEGFSWIYSRRKIDMYLAQPITRGHRFLMTYINGILIYFIPYIISLLLALLLLSGMGAASGALFADVLFTLPAAFVYFLAVYNLTLTAMMISGKKGMAAFLVLMSFLYDLLLRTTLESFCSSYFSTFAGRATSRQYISPICRIVVMLNENTFSWGKEIVTFSEIKEELILPMLPGMAVLLLEAVLFGAAAYICYKRRPMEAVSQALSFRMLRGPVKVLLILLSGLLACLGFCNVSDNNGFLVAFSGLAFGVLFCQALVEIVYEGELKAFGRHKKSFGIGAFITVCVYLFFALDISGYDTWVPEQEQVESAAIDIYFGNHYRFENVDEDGNPVWEDDFILDTMKMTDVSGVLSLARDGMGKDAREQNEDTQLNCDVKYILKNGKERYRSFTIDYEQEKTVLDILFANEKYKEGANQVLSGEMDRIFEKSRAYYSNGLQEREIADKNALRLMRAYQADVREMSFSDVKDAVPCGFLKLDYRTDAMGENTLEYPVFPSFTKTVEYLRGKNIELYLNIIPQAVESIKVVYYGRSEEDTEVITNGGFFVNTQMTTSIETETEKEYTDRGQIEELLGSIYPSYLTGWLYIPEIVDGNMSAQIQEADNNVAWYYNWNDTFVMKKDKVPEFVRKDMGVDRNNNDR